MVVERDRELAREAVRLEIVDPGRRVRGAVRRTTRDHAASDSHDEEDGRRDGVRARDAREARRLGVAAPHLCEHAGREPVGGRPGAVVAERLEAAREQRVVALGELRRRQTVVHERSVFQRASFN